MSGRRLSLGLEIHQPLLGSPIALPLLFLTVVCGTLGWLVWSPYGVAFGVLPPAVVFGFAVLEFRRSRLPKLPAAESSPPLALDGEVDLVSDLHAAGIFTEGTSGDLALSSRFSNDWQRRMAGMDGREHDRNALADLLGVERARVEMGWDERGLFAQLDGGNIGRWTSRAAFVADLTAVMTFRRHYPEWWELSTADRNRVLGALRLSLHRCPTCEGSVDVDTERVSDAGTTKKRHVTVTCLACDAELFDAVVDETTPTVSSTDTEAGTPPHNTR
ncbi:MULTISPECIES: hypothetical protein [Haloferax]|uniref:Uncharacterized protein n=1 Tax=Haloferax marinum TaxID=2666143 RepID=A0A6A8G2U3_9EURY|nr:MULTISPECIES: hypothetical protein [Haloferax]KAB1196045.1 hypothetical protein Hfx1150_00355 [Haloferax sp. CBA1150]MRW95025.1 hypothetical protein [Haloferax marinum]